MFSIIFAGNSFWLTERLLNSGLLAACIFFLYTSLKEFDALRPSLAQTYKENRVFLTIAISHLTLQFIYHFVYSFAFVDYLSRMVFILIVIYLNRVYLSYLKSISDEQKLQIEKYLLGFSVFVFFIIFLSILNSKADNSCGQSLFAFYVLIYLVLALVSFANAYLNLRSIAGDLDVIFRNIESADLQFIQSAEQVVYKLGKLREFFYHFLVAVFASCVLHSFLQYLKLRDVLNYTATCRQLFASANFLFKVFFVLLEFAAKNTINAFIFYHYFWKIRDEFVVKEELQERATEEAFQGNRSVLIHRDKENPLDN